ncbi:MAG: Hsp70 family protein [Lachnospiraceae bacterium]|nr:Hsp70 family protein [Lachnospiraceae bacterium]
MDRFYGFDLGDAESAVSCLKKEDTAVPRIIPVREAGSFITAYALLRDGELLIGESACYHPDAARRRIRFKSRFLTDPESAKDIKRFAAGVLGELYQSGDLVKGEDSCFYVGCPAGWNRAAREQYREIFEEAGYPPVRIISESRAALVSACQSKHFQIGYDILSKPVLVVDVGSSTTDFAYIMGGKEVELQTAGEVALGGGIMDEIILETALCSSPQEDYIRKVFEDCPPWKSYCEFAARRLKEKYFSDEQYFSQNPCRQSVPITYGRPVRLMLEINEQTAARMLEKGAAQLGGRSFREVFMESLRGVQNKIQGEKPELIFLTGGVSKMRAVRAWCREAFPESLVITGAEPEYSVSRGLAWSGRIDEELREFRMEVQELVGASTVERLVQERIGELYRSTVDTLVEPILTNVAMPVFDRWRAGEIRRLCDIDAVMEKEIETWLHSEQAQALLVKPIAAWLKPVAYALEEYTMPICLRHGIPHKALSLSSYLSLSEIDIRVDARDVFAVEELTWMIDTIISILVGLLCGGSGVALISGGLSGVVTGAVLSLLLLILGKDKMQEAVMQADIPIPMRKIVPRKHFTSRMSRISADVKASFYESLEKDKNDEITKRMSSDIAQQIEQCLTRMAEVVEIPLG